MEKAELLRDADANILPAFLRLQELVRQCSSPFAFVIELCWMIKRKQKSRSANERPSAERVDLGATALKLKPQDSWRC